MGNVRVVGMLAAKKRNPGWAAQRHGRMVVVERKSYMSPAALRAAHSQSHNITRTILLDAFRDGIYVVQRSEQEVLVVREEEEDVGRLREHARTGGEHCPNGSESREKERTHRRGRRASRNLWPSSLEAWRS